MKTKFLIILSVIASVLIIAAITLAIFNWSNKNPTPDEFLEKKYGMEFVTTARLGPFAYCRPANSGNETDESVVTVINTKEYAAFLTEQGENVPENYTKALYVDDGYFVLKKNDFETFYKNVIKSVYSEKSECVISWRQSPAESDELTLDVPISEALQKYAIFDAVVYIFTDSKELQKITDLQQAMETEHLQGVVRVLYSENGLVPEINNFSYFAYWEENPAIQLGSFFLG